MLLGMRLETGTTPLVAGMVVLLVVCLLASMLLPACGKRSQATAEGEEARAKPYVASVLRDPFHNSSCKWAQKIHTSNLVGYDTREQAIADGHRPCKVCRP